MSVAGSWFGHIAGTNRGAVSVVLQQGASGQFVVGRAHIRDGAYGALHGLIDGQFDGHQLKARITTITSNAPVSPTVVEIVAVLDPAGKELKGEWKSDIGTSGTLMLTRDAQDQQPLAGDD